MQESLFKKGITLSVIVLLIGMSIPTTANILEYNNDFGIKEAESSFCLSEKRFYAVRAGYPHTFVWFDPEIPTILHDIGTFPSNNFPQGATFVKDVMWVCDTIGHIYKKDPDSPNSEYIGNAGIGGLDDIEYDPKAETLWGISIPNFYCINLTTGKATIVGDGPSVSIYTIATDNNGIMWGIGGDIQGAKLYSIDTSNWNTTLIGYVEGISSLSKISYEKDEGVLWCCTLNYSTFKGELWTIDTNTATATFVGTFQEGTQIACIAIPYNWTNLPPNSPIITGPTNGIIGVVYDYNFTLFDPNNNILYLRVDWGIGCPGKWHGPFASGTIVTLNYSWQKKDSYTIRAQSMDIYGLESNWSYLDVKIPKNMQSVSYWWLIRLLNSIQSILLSGK